MISIIRILGENLRSPERIEARTEWVNQQLEQAGQDHGILPQGGAEAPQLWLETRNAYSYGLFISSVVLGAAVIENILGQLLVLYTPEYEHGDQLPSLRRAKNKAKEYNLITESEYKNIEKVQHLRNSYVHHRYGFEENSPAARREEYDLPGRYHPNLIGKEDAETVIPVVIEMATRAWDVFDEKVKESGNPN